MLLYSVDDLRRWKYEGIWFSTEDPLAARHLPAAIWECPQLVRVPDSSGAETWVLMASLWLPADEHDHPNGVGYLLGSLAAEPRRAAGVHAGVGRESGPGAGVLRPADPRAAGPGAALGLVR